MQGGLPTAGPRPLSWYPMPGAAMQRAAAAALDSAGRQSRHLATYASMVCGTVSIVQRERICACISSVQGQILLQSSQQKCARAFLLAGGWGGGGDWDSADRGSRCYSRLNDSAWAAAGCLLHLSHKGIHLHSHTRCLSQSYQHMTSTVRSGPRSTCCNKW
jgi:hypothetical protein